MSETQRPFFNKRAGGLLIAGAFLLLMIVVVVSDRSPSTPEPESVKVSTLPSPRRVHRRSPKVFDSQAFYATIIDNNLFRPLGWTPPRPVEPYRLLGTILPTDKNTLPQAIIQAAAGNKTHIVGIGERLSTETKVIAIQSKQVTLDSKGQRRILKLDTSAWINVSKRQFSHRR